MPLLGISKSISGITRKSIATNPIPGATVSYLISYSNYGTGSGNSTTIFDALPFNNITFYSAYQGTASNWTNQYSTNQHPNQAYNSVNYTNYYSAATKLHIKWVRFKKPVIAASEKGTFFIQLIIK